MASEDIEIETGESKPVKEKPAAKKASAKIEPKAAKPAAKKAPKEKAAKPAKEKAAKAKKAKAEGEEPKRKRFTINYTGEKYGVKIDKAFEKKIASYAKQYEFETANDAVDDLLRVAFGRLAALKKWQDTHAE